MRSEERGGSLSGSFSGASWWRHPLRGDGLPAGRIQLPGAATAWRSVFTRRLLEQEVQFSSNSVGLPVIVATRG